MSPRSSERPSANAAPGPSARSWTKSTLLICCIVALALASSAYAQQIRYVSYSNGTGFFVTKDGYIVTNAHVVRGCTSLVRTSGAMVTDAEIIARDDANDLALLRAKQFAPAAAYLRSSDTDLKAGEAAIVMGYPGAAGAAGQVSFVKSHVISPIGPTGETKWMQFENAAQKGNSGGPLLDMSGHVIGVITGKTQTFRVDRRVGVAPTKVAESDVAITLATLKQFLNKNRVRFATSSSNLLFFSDNRLQYDAKNYILQLKCVTGVKDKL